MQGANHLQYEQVRGMRCLFFKSRDSTMKQDYGMGKDTCLDKLESPYICFVV